MRVKILLLTSGIRAVLSCSLSISCSSPSIASQQPLPAAEATAAAIPAAPAQPPSSVQTSSSLSDGGSTPRSSSSSPPAARHVRRTLSALGRLERAAPAGGRTRCSGGARAGSGRDRCRSSKGVEAGSLGRHRCSTHRQRPRPQVHTAHFARSGRTWHSSRVRTSTTSPSVSTP
jgi:hypothetical protein